MGERLEPEPKQQEETPEEKKPEYGNSYVRNPWDEWKDKATRKGLFHENAG